MYVNYHLVKPTDYAPFDPALRGTVMPATLTDVLTREVRYTLTSDGWFDLQKRVVVPDEVLNQQTWRYSEGGLYNHITGVVHTGAGQLAFNVFVDVHRTGRGTRRYEVAWDAPDAKKARLWRLMRRMQDLLILHTAGFDVNTEGL